MQLDSFFIIGKSHKVCEDYALCNSASHNFFGVSDGCSSSKDTDFGSRILLKSFEQNTSFMFDRKYIEAIWARAVNITDTLKMPVTCLDATINIGYNTQVEGVDAIQVICIGDGFIVAQMNDNSFELIEIEYDQNAPYYLSYVFDTDRKKQYMAQNQKKKVTIKEYNENLELTDEYPSTTDENIKVDEFSKLWFPTSVYKSVSLFSDGLKTFIPHDQTKQKIPLAKIVKELISFPIINGEFVKRRCMKFIKTYPEHAFYDDVSMATCINER